MWNQIKTAVLLAGLSGIFMLIGSMLGGYNGLVTAGIMAIIVNGLAYFFSDKMVLSMYNAKPLDKQKYEWVYDIVNELCHKANLPSPKLWLIETTMANAFATGRNPQHASVAVTTGILDILDKEELRGVLAHELCHVKNRDILISSIAAALATAIGYIANITQNMALWGSFSRGSNDNQRQGPHPLAVLVIAILMPIAATLIQLAISRSREYLADESGADLCHDPLALAAALEKLQNASKKIHFQDDDSAHASTAHLFIVNPFLGSGLSALFSTHPPMKQRIAILRKIYEAMASGKR